MNPENKIMFQEIANYLKAAKIFSKTSFKELVTKVWEENDNLYFKTKVQGKENKIGVFVGREKDLNKKFSRFVEEITLHMNRMLETKEGSISEIIHKSGKTEPEKEGMRLRKSFFKTEKGEIFLAITADIRNRSKNTKKKQKKKSRKA